MSVNSLSFTNIELLGTVFFALAVLHTFFVGQIARLSHRFSRDSLWSNLFHLLAEIEVVFALWAALFMTTYILTEGWGEALAYQKSLNFTEPFFIFAIMVVCSTRPILAFARQLIGGLSSLVQKVLRTPAIHTDIAVILIFGSLSGSFITEPAAMTVTAFMLNSLIVKHSSRMIYTLLAVLFVNISIGGALTPFAAPPLLMVAGKWNWDLTFVLTQFGWKSAIAVTVNSIGLVFAFRKELFVSCITLRDVDLRMAGAQARIPLPVTLIHLLFLTGLVLTGHYQNAFLGIFLLFMGVASVTQRYQDHLRLKESLLVSLFLGGIIQFGAFQKWWLTPLLGSLGEWALFKGAVILTAITDNAALTYLGSQVPGLSDGSKYALVAGALAGGGLTIIANAPNAAGYSILSHRFQGGLKPVALLLSAIVPTAVAAFCLWML